MLWLAWSRQTSCAGGPAAHLPVSSFEGGREVASGESQRGSGPGSPALRRLEWVGTSGLLRRGQVVWEKVYLCDGTCFGTGLSAAPGSTAAQVLPAAGIQWEMVLGLGRWPPALSVLTLPGPVRTFLLMHAWLR